MLEPLADLNQRQMGDADQPTLEILGPAVGLLAPHPDPLAECPLHQAIRSHQVDVEALLDQRHARAAEDHRLRLELAGDLENRDALLADRQLDPPPLADQGQIAVVDRQRERAAALRPDRQLILGGEGGGKRRGNRRSGKQREHPRRLVS